MWGHRPPGRRRPHHAGAALGALGMRRISIHLKRNPFKADQRIVCVKNSNLLSKGEVCTVLNVIHPRALLVRVVNSKKQSITASADIFAAYNPTMEGQANAPEKEST